MDEWDSVAAITLVNLMEEEFNVQVDYDRLTDLGSFGQILEYLTNDLGAR